jgi:hypothetical protein
LLVAEPRNGSADTALALSTLHFEDLTLGVGIGSRAEIFADTLAVEPAGEVENDIPGGIRERRDDERSDWLHDRFAASTGKSVSKFH